MIVAKHLKHERNDEQFQLITSEESSKMISSLNYSLIPGNVSHRTQRIKHL